MSEAAIPVAEPNQTGSQTPSKGRRGTRDSAEKQAPPAHHRHRRVGDDDRDGCVWIYFHRDGSVVAPTGTVGRVNGSGASSRLCRDEHYLHAE